MDSDPGGGREEGGGVGRGERRGGKEEEKVEKKEGGRVDWRREWEVGGATILEKDLIESTDGSGRGPFGGRGSGGVLLGRRDLGNWRGSGGRFR